MSITYLTTNSIGTGRRITETGGSGVLEIADGTSLHIDENVSIVSTSTYAIEFEAADLALVSSGNIVGNTDGVRLDFENPNADTAFNYIITLTETSHVWGANFGMYVGSNSHGSVNLGSIIWTNRGEVFGATQSGALLFFAAEAIVTNTGLIESQSTGTSFATGLNFYDITDAYLSNSGTIRSSLSHTVGTWATAAVAFSNGTQNVVMVNDGLIESGVSAVYSDALTSESLTNNGRIRGDVSASNSVGGTLVNSGHIEGSVFLRGGNDHFVNSGGTVSGTIEGGFGDDTYSVDRADLLLVEVDGQGIDLVESSVSYSLQDNIENLTLTGSNDINGFGNSLDNELTGNEAANLVVGYGGADTLTGNGGNDTLRGGNGDDDAFGNIGDDVVFLGAGNDTGRGGDGDDRLVGRRGNDSLLGGNESDTLIGNAGDDTLKGGADNDTLIGGLGVDELTGGSDADVFRFNRVADSRNGSADRILDFDVDEDLLDLSAIVGPGGIDVVIGGAFTGGGQASIRTNETATETQVFVDTDGDGAADMRINLTGVTNFEVDNLIL